MTEHWTEEEHAEFADAVDENSSAPVEAPTSWWPINLEPILAGIQAGHIVGPVPTLMPRTDGPSLLYPGEVHSLAGEPETGKGWIALHAAATVLADGGHVLYVDFEDAPASILTRLLALGASDSTILERFTYVRPDDPFTASTLDALLASRTYTLAIIDGLSEAYTLLGLDPYNNVDAAKFLAALARPIANTGAAVLLIDHVTKAKEGRNRYALGAQHKLAGIAVAYGTEAITAPSRTTAGQIKLKVEKDRHGHVRPHATAGQIALVHITPEDNGQRVTVTLDAPDVSFTTSGKQRYTIYMERVSTYLHANPGASRNRIRDDVEGGTDFITKALTSLIDEAFVEVRPEGQTHRHYNLHPFTKQPGLTRTQPGLSPGTGDRDTGTPSLRGPGPGSHHPNNHHQDQ